MYYSILESKYDNEERTCILERIGDALPHGSGIDSDWAIKLVSPTRVQMQGGYHCMDEAGGYDGWAYFTCTIDIKDPEVWRIVFNGRESQYKARKYDLRDFLTDTICECLFFHFDGGEIC